VHLHAGSLVNPAHIEPNRHVHVGEQLPWAEVHDELPRYEKTSREGRQPVRKGPRR
jgi:hypothetical protein